MEKMKLHSPDLVRQNIARIAELFPGCVTEAQDDKGNIKQAIDFDLLRQELTDHVVEGPSERFHLNWPGKKQALVTANAPIAKTLRPYTSESVDFETTNNLFIEGDNLDALKLLQETYLSRVKLIYIDPPYNTGRDFVYDDNFSSKIREFFSESEQNDVDGNRLVANLSTDGRFHSNWLSMMYSRLRLARNLLTDDGAIFINIDDGEQASLKRICDEIFGESNFIVNAIWRSKDNSNNDAHRFSYDHNHTLIYSKSPNWQPARISDDAKRSHFKNPDDDPNGPYFDGNPLNSPHYRENLVYKLESPTGHLIEPPKNGWRWSRAVMQEKIDNGEIRFTADGRNIRRRTYLKDMKGLPPSSLWIDLETTGHNRQAKYELLKLLPEDVFDTPKPVRLLKHILKLGNASHNDIVLDFFAGSATTADAVLQLNAEDGAKRRFILIQIPEHCPERSEAAKAGFRTIAEISKERIRRAAESIGNDGGVLFNSIDLGFRVLKVDTSNMKSVYFNPDSLDRTVLFDQIENIKEDRTSEDLLFQVMLDWGVDLTLPIATESIEEKPVFFVDGNSLVACFEKGVSESLVKKLAERKPLRVVFRDAGFENDSVKINVEQIFKLLSPGTEVKSI
jgi:adenine-specific DNA-methyltransferase